MRITHEAYQKIVEHAIEDAPIEACGYLAAVDDAAGGVIVEAIRLRNVDASEEHFSFDPAEQFAVVRAIRKSGRKLLAVYHSHPASPARPSQEDIRLAFDAELSYVIASLAGTEPDVRSFRIRNGDVEREEIEIVNQTAEVNHVL
ncbi:M67 family metallopeptidase [Telmatobacter bradus]|uniref:M67 family metallopeptidase n=1 Tax=Telmatobacter bradus TaxID=474953 RepID=UPI003B42BDB0